MSARCSNNSEWEFEGGIEVKDDEDGQKARVSSTKEVIRDFNKGCFIATVRSRIFTLKRRLEMGW